jgi:hypothetical protein
MEEATRQRSTHVVGRDSELVELEAFLQDSSGHTPPPEPRRHRRGEEPLGREAHPVHRPALT